MIWTILAIIAAACLIVLGVLLAAGLKAGRDYDSRMDDIVNGRHRYQYPKKP